MKYVTFIVLLLVPNAAFSGVYRCEDSEGRVNYQDKRCGADAQQEYLPVKYQKTQPKQVLLQERELKQIEKQHDNKVKALGRKNKQLEKNKQKFLKKKKRFEERCAKAQENIEHLQATFRGGYPVRRDASLKRRLKEQRQLESRYCVKVEQENKP